MSAFRVYLAVVFALLGAYTVVVGTNHWLESSGGILWRHGSDEVARPVQL